MKRPYIDKAHLAQFARLEYLLRDVVRSGGRDRWDHLFSHGHRFPTIISAIRQGYLRTLSPTQRRFAITNDGRRMLADVEQTAMQGAG